MMNKPTPVLRCPLTGLEYLVSNLDPIVETDEQFNHRCFTEI